MVKKLEEISQWSFKGAATLKGYPQNQNYKNPYQFESIKSQYQEQIEKKLFSLWANEEKLQNFVKGIDIEYILDRLAKRCRVRGNSLFKGTAELIDDNFAAAQKKILFRLLNTIEENYHT